MSHALYEGIVEHRRFEPKAHAISMKLAMPLLDLDTLDDAFDSDARFGCTALAVARFSRHDHVCEGAPSLAEAIRLLVENRIGKRPSGAVRLLTNLRYFGYGFNPVSFYYCYDGDARDERLAAIVSEVNNTPWGERHCYVHDARALSGPSYQFEFDKAFHVSPFMALEQRYTWRFTEPSEALRVHMTNHARERLGGRGVFAASMNLHRLPWTRASRTRLLLRYPLLTAQVVGAIYGHAAVLKLKGVPYVPHPNDSDHLSAPQPGTARTSFEGDSACSP